MLGDGNTYLGSEFVGGMHDERVIDEVAVIADGDGAGGDEFGDGSNLVTGAVHGDGAGGQDADDALVLCVVGGADQPVRGVERWLGVGHLNDGGVAAGSRSGGARGDGFFVGLAGGAEVGVKIDKAGGDEEAGSLDLAHIGVSSSDAGTYLGDTPVDNQQVSDFVATGSGVNDATADDEERDGLLGGFRHGAFVCTRGLISAPRVERMSLVHWRG